MFREADQGFQPFRVLAVNPAAASDPARDGRLMTAKPPCQFALAPAKHDEAEQQAMR
jgi:hypothetical protein